VLSVKRKGRILEQPPKHGRTSTLRLKTLNHFTVVPSPLSQLRFYSVRRCLCCSRCRCCNYHPTQSNAAAVRRCRRPTCPPRPLLRLLPLLQLPCDPVRRYCRRPPPPRQLSAAASAAVIDSAAATVRRRPPLPPYAAAAALAVHRCLCCSLCLCWSYHPAPSVAAAVGRCRRFFRPPLPPPELSAIFSAAVATSAVDTIRRHLPLPPSAAATAPAVRRCFYCSRCPCCTYQLTPSAGAAVGRCHRCRCLPLPPPELSASAPAVAATRAAATI